MTRLLRPLPTARKPLLIGEAPSRLGDPSVRFPLSGATARVLCELAGIRPQVTGTTWGRWYWPLRAAFDTVHLLERWPAGTPARVTRLAPAVAAELAQGLDLHGRVVVCLGRTVAEAVGAGPFGQWCELDGDVDAVAIPNPSTMNRLLIDPAVRVACSQTLAQARDRAARKVPVDA